MNRYWSYFFNRGIIDPVDEEDSDAASRRFGKIDKHVRWIHAVLLAGRRTRVLDLACGPGLYTSRLARLGHECSGIDFAPAAIAHARAGSA